MEIAELLRWLRAGVRDRVIAKTMGHTRRTVQRYRQWVEQGGLLTGELPAVGELQRLLGETLPNHLPPQQTSSVARYAAEITELRHRGREAAAIRARLEERHPTPIS